MMTGMRIYSLLLLIVATLISVSSDDGSNPSSKVSCSTTKGTLIIDIYRKWAPIGADHFIKLVKFGFFQNIAFFRCVEGFLTQFGISDNPAMKHWHEETIMDDVNQNIGIHKNYLSFAGAGTNSRSTELFISFEDLDFLGKEPWETPFGVVALGQDTLDDLYRGYGEIVPFNTNGVDQQKIFVEGNQYLRDSFPKLDYIKSCSVIEENGLPFMNESEKEKKEAMEGNQYSSSCATDSTF